MTSTQTTKPSGWFTGRTRLVTVVSIVAVSLAGATAVSANIGILDTASDSPVGNASATGDLITPAQQVVDVYLPETTVSSTPVTTGPAADPAVQQFAVDVAGIVAVAPTDSGLRLDRVDPAPGWSWTLAQSDPASLHVTMTNGARTFEFSATKNADGTIAASVNEVIVTPAPPATTRVTTHDDDDDEHDDEHEDEHEEEHEGGEDDD